MRQTAKHRIRPNYRLTATAFAALATLALIFGRAQACPPHYTIEFFDGPDCDPQSLSETMGLAINSSGNVVGNYFACPLANSKAFKWSSGPDITLLTFPPGTGGSQAFAIADDGAIVGDYDGPGGTGGAFLRAGTVLIPLGFPDGANYAYPNGVNSAHVVVGQSGNTYTVQEEFAFRWVSGKFEDLTPYTGYGHAGAKCISESGVIAGWAGASETSPGSPACIWNGTRVTILPLPDGAYAATAFSITNNGQKCGDGHFPYTAFPFITTHGVVWADGRVIDVGVLPGDDRSQLGSINSSGMAVGLSGNYATFLDRPILWDGQTIHVLQDLIDGGIGTGKLLAAKAINDAGQITGFAEFLVPGFGHTWLGYRLNPIPPKVGDTNCDAHINVDDLLNVINGWGPCAKGALCGSDLNQDNVVNTEDLMIVIKNWNF